MCASDGKTLNVINIALSKFDLEIQQFDLISNAALQCTEIISENTSVPAQFNFTKSHLPSRLTNGFYRNTKFITNQILISKYSKSPNSAIEMLQKAGITGKINSKRIELAARRFYTSLQSLYRTYSWLLLQPEQTIKNTRLRITQTLSDLQLI